MEKEHNESDEMKLIMQEGEKAEQQVKEGIIMEDVQEQKGLGKDTELLLSIDKKLDMLLAAQDIR